MSPRTGSEVLEEVWEANDRACVTLSPTKSISMSETPITEGVMIMEDATDCARARVAACAPEALKLLVELEWAVGGTECPACGQIVRHAGQDGKEGACVLYALLQKAGLR
jgi:hypothetical protein